MFFIILPLGYILFVTEGNEIFHRVCRIAGFLVIVVSTLVYHLGIPDNPDAFYLTYLILPISWGIMALLCVQEYKHNYIEIDTWEIFVSVLILMAVFVATQYISFGTPTADGIKRAVNIYLIVGGVALAVLGIVKLKERGIKRE